MNQIYRIVTCSYLAISFHIWVSFLMHVKFFMSSMCTIFSGVFIITLKAVPKEMKGLLEKISSQIERFVWGHFSHISVRTSLTLCQSSRTSFRKHIIKSVQAWHSLCNTIHLTQPSWGLAAIMSTHWTVTTTINILVMFVRHGLTKCEEHWFLYPCALQGL